MTMLDAALDYAANYGWPVFPVKAGQKVPLTPNGFKDATLDLDQIERWWRQFPDANIGCVTGKVSGLLVVDIDVKNGQPGRESSKELNLPGESLISGTPSGGWHYVFRHPGIEIRNRTGLLPGIDIRADGGYIVVPPSQVDGKPYQWLTEANPVDIPDHLLDRLKAPPRPALNGGARINEGGRNDHLARLAGAMRSQGLERESIEAALLAENTARCLPPLVEAEVKQIAASIARYDAPGPSDWPDPMALPDELPSVEAFNPGLLPTPVRGWCEDVSDRMQCPPDYPAVAAVVALGSLIGRSMRIRPKAEDTWTVICNLWGAIIGRPGVMKTPALQEVLRFVRHAEDDAREAHEEAIRDHELATVEYRNRRKVAEEQYRQVLKKDARATFAGDLDEPEAPTRTRYLVNDPTTEKLGELLNQNPNGLLLFRDELVGFLRLLERQGREADRAFYLEAWNGDSSFVYDRIGRGTIDIEAACVSILGGIQPGPLMSYLRTLNANSAADDGLLQRFQLLVWPDVSSNWRDVDRPPNAAAFEAMQNLIARLTTDKGDRNPFDTSVGSQSMSGNTHSRPSDSSVSSQSRSVDSISGPFVGFASDAQECFRAWRTTLEQRLRSDSEHPVIESHLAKYRSLVPSLALIDHVAEGTSGLIAWGSVDRAIRWAHYLESHARRVYYPAIHRDTDAARLLLKRLRKGPLPNPFSLRDVYRNGWTGLGDPETVEGAAMILEDYDWLRSRREPTGGRTRLIFEVNPKISNVRT